MAVLNLNPILIASTLLVSALGCSTAWADAQFTVPVNVKNANPNISKMGVRCRLLSANKTSLAVRDVPFPLTGNAYQGTVSVNVSYSGPTSQVKSWQCSIIITMADGGSSEFGPGNSPPDSIQPLPGSTAIVTGDY